MLNVAYIAQGSKIYGPGIRSVIWFQGCSIHCKGCINKKLQPFVNKNLYSIDALASIVKNKRVTLLGGEPLDQLEIYSLLKIMHKRGISIVLFTGYDWSDLSKENRDIIQNTCDLVISGPYVEKLRDDRLYLRGSSNQTMMAFKNIEDLSEKETYEVVIGDDVEIRGRVNGDIFDILERNK